MSLEIAWKQNILVKDSNLLKLLLVVFGFGSQTFICGFSRQNICSVHKARILRKKPLEKTFLEFKKWVKSIQTAGYNGARTVYTLLQHYHK